MKKSLLLLGGALVLFSNSAFGWGKMGHDAIAYIAECNLTPKAKKTIEKILGHSIVYYATYEGENETYIEASVENSGSILYDK